MFKLTTHVNHITCVSALKRSGAALTFCVTCLQILVELAELQDAEVGDGTTSVVILAAELMKRANELVRNKIHPTNIIAGYRLAMREVRLLGLLTLCCMPVNTQLSVLVVQSCSTARNSCDGLRCTQPCDM